MFQFLLLFHCAITLHYQGSQLGASSLAHQHHLVVSSLTYQGLPWARLLSELPGDLPGPCFQRPSF